MNPREGGAYRLELARRPLLMAEENLKPDFWPSAVANAQLVVENAAKAICACFGPVPKTHDTAEVLQLLTGTELPREIVGQIEAVIPIAREYGRKKHIQATYGEEEAFLTPWAIFGEKEARQAVEDARRCLAVATGVYEHFFGQG
ncbi:MAG: HEPN domain-containing protein [Anaerolineae bacterium]